MKINKLEDTLKLRNFTGEYDNALEVTGVHIGDLLSWVMSHAKTGELWITVQVHPNIIAVAELLEIKCILLPDNIEPEEVTVQKAKENGVIILGSELSSYELACGIKESGL